MKHNYYSLFIFCMVSFFTNAQDIVYNFDTDTEGWVKIASATTEVTQSNGTLVVGTNISNYGGTLSPELNIQDTSYDFLEFVIQNNTTLTGFQLLSYVTGGTVGSTATKTNFEVPADGAFHTIVVAIPSTPGANNGNITNLGVRVTGDPAAGESIVFDAITIKEAAEPSYNGFVKNPNFDDIDGSLGGWSLVGTGCTVAVSTDTNSGTQAAEFTYNANIPSNPPTLFNNYRWSMAPAAIGNIETLTVTWDMKSSDATTLVKVAPRWKMNIVGGSGDRVTYGAPQTATDTYATYSVTRAISNVCADQASPVEGSNCYDTETYDNIELGMSARDGDAGVKVTIDNIISTITGTSLGIESVLFKDDANITVFPNPGNNNITINAPTLVKGIKVINTLGQICIIQSGFSNTLDISQLKSGIYILKILQDNGTSSTKRFIKQ